MLRFHEDVQMETFVPWAGRATKMRQFEQKAYVARPPLLPSFLPLRPCIRHLYIANSNAPDPSDFEGNVDNDRDNDNDNDNDDET